jgi:hypothetical protein
MPATQADPRVEKAMAALKAATDKLGVAKLDGEEPVGGKDDSGSALHYRL